MTENDVNPPINNDPLEKRNEFIIPRTLIFTRVRLGLLGISFHQFVTELCSLMSHDFCQNFVSAQYRSIERIDEMWSNFGCALIVTKSRLGLLRVKFHTFIHNRFMVLDWFRISFPLNILRTNWWNLNKFCLCIDTDSIKVWVMALDWCQNFVLFNILRTSRWNSTKFVYAIDKI